MKINTEENIFKQLPTIIGGPGFYSHPHSGMDQGFLFLPALAIFDFKDSMLLLDPLGNKVLSLPSPKAFVAGAVGLTTLAATGELCDKAGSMIGASLGKSVGCPKAGKSLGAIAGKVVSIAASVLVFGALLKIEKA